MRLVVISGLALVWMLNPSAAQDLRHGRYAVEVEVTLPNINLSAHTETFEICWRGPEDPKMPLGPLGRGPLRACPAEAVWSDEKINVTTTCSGPNAGFATAIYETIPGGFRGVVDLNMGGKNMRVGERQRGRFIGSC
jgi:hypothetical protein